MTSLLAQIRHLNGLDKLPIAEPFAGGAGASLSLLYKEKTKEIYINDADVAIHDLWWSLINRPASFLDRLESISVDMTEWKKQRAIYQSQERTSRLNRGFAAFYMNRCNRSGILSGGPIGGMEQKGYWKIDERFNRDNLLERCTRVSNYRRKIHVSNKDGMKFIKESKRNSLFFFIDPPYFHKGETLYLNSLDPDYHAHLANLLKSMTKKSWVLTYDDCPEIREMYQDWATVIPFSFHYFAAERRKGKEVLITPKWMTLPENQKFTAISW